MNAVRIIILIVAALAAVIAAVFVRGAMQPAAPAPSAVAAPEPEVAQTLVASRDVQAGERVQSDAFRWADWPEEAIIAAYLRQDADGEAMERLSGAVARTPIAAGEPILERKLVQPGEAGFMAAVVTPGMRAVAVPTSAEAGAGGFILPNDRVDILMTTESEGRFLSEVVVENVRVLAIDQTYNEEEDGAVLGSTATLEMTPTQARAVALSLAAGDVILALRSVADGQGGPRTPGAGPDPETPGVGRTVRVIRYGEETQVALGGSR